MLTQVIFASTRTLDVRFDFVIRKSDIFRRSLGIEHHFSLKKNIFAAARVIFFFVTRCAGNKPIIIFGLIKKLKSNVNLHQFLKTLPCFVFIPCNKPGPISVHVFTGLPDLFVDIVLAKGQCKRGSFLYRRSAPSPSRVEGLSRS